MITLEKLRTYRKFRADIDGYARSHGRGDTSEISDADWRLIDELRQALHIIISGKASPEFTTIVTRRLSEVCADKETREELRNLAGETGY
jgi:hypothetical protein